jgi:hypothetical protein
MRTRRCALCSCDALSSRAEGSASACASHGLCGVQSALAAWAVTILAIGSPASHALSTLCCGPVPPLPATRHACFVFAQSHTTAALAFLLCTPRKRVSQSRQLSSLRGPHVLRTGTQHSWRDTHSKPSAEPGLYSTFTEETGAQRVHGDHIVPSRPAVPLHQTAVEAARPPTKHPHPCAARAPLRPPSRHQTPCWAQLASHSHARSHAANLNLRTVPSLVAAAPLAKPLLLGPHARASYSSPAADPDAGQRSGHRRPRSLAAVMASTRQPRTTPLRSRPPAAPLSAPALESPTGASRAASHKARLPQSLHRDHRQMPHSYSYPS